MRKVNVHSYHLPDITDLAVLRAQAEKRRDRDGEVTIIHQHQHFDQKEPGRILCTDECKIYIPGEQIRSVTLQEARS